LDTVPEKVSPREKKFNHSFHTANPQGHWQEANGEEKYIPGLVPARL
jgi:hypothetical protein